MEFRKRNRFEKYLEIFLTQSYIALKITKEYKSNLYSVILIDVILLFLYFTFFTIYTNIINLNWNKIDFITYYLFGLLQWKFIWFVSLMNFKKTLILGELNTRITKPTNTLFLSLIKNINGSTIITTILTLIALFSLLSISNYQNYLLTIIVNLIGIIYFFLYFNLFESSAFFIKENQFLITLIRKSDSTIKKFTGIPFESLQFNFMFLFPSMIISFFPLLILKNNFLFFEYLKPVLISMLILVTLFIIIWHYGLKKYEAYG